MLDHKKKKTIDQCFQESSLKRKNELSKENGKTESFQKIADESDLNVMVVRRILAGKRTAKLGEAYAIAKALGSTLSFLTSSSDQVKLQSSAHEMKKIGVEVALLQNQMRQSLDNLVDCDTRTSVILNKAFSKYS